MPILPLSLMFMLSASFDPSDKVEVLEQLRHEDVRVATVAYRLATGSSAICPRRSSWTGLLVHDLAQYAVSYRTEARTVLGLSDGPAVEAVIADSPAAAAGVRAGDQIVAIAGVATARPPATPSVSYAPLAQTLAMLDRAAETGRLVLRLRRGPDELTTTVIPRPGCASSVQLDTNGGVNAAADGDMISVTARAAQLLASPSELAVLVSHEMAHNILRHRDRLERQGARPGVLAELGIGAAAIRRTEEEADTLGLYLMARAGFDVEIAAQVWQRLGQRAAHGLFTGPTHPGWRTRAAQARATAARIKAAQARGDALVPPMAIPAAPASSKP